MTPPMLALPVGPEGREMAAYHDWRERCEIVGPWLRLERDLAESLTAALVDYDGAHLLDWGGKRWMFAGAPGQQLVGGPLLFRGDQHDPAWARVRVRVSVEVLDGVL